MSDQPKRTRAGQFEKGQSGNPAGAGSRKPTPMMSPQDVSHTIMQIANRKTQLRTERGIETVNMLERNALALASGSKVGTAPRAFIDIVRTAALDIQRHRERQEEKARLEARHEAQR